VVLIPALRRPRQRKMEREFKASLGYIVRSQVAICFFFGQGNPEAERLFMFI
jgi:hypothetical protein